MSTEFIGLSMLTSYLPTLSYSTAHCTAHSLLEQLRIAYAFTNIQIVAPWNYRQGERRSNRHSDQLL
jgi:hypothetical protein